MCSMWFIYLSAYFVQVYPQMSHLTVADKLFSLSGEEIFWSTSNVNAMHITEYESDIELYIMVYVLY